MTQDIDTKNPEGRYFMRTIANLAEFERDMIQKRTKAGLAAAKDQGRIGGRPAGINKCELIHFKIKVSFLISSENTNLVIKHYRPNIISKHIIVPRIKSYVPSHGTTILSFIV